MCACQRDVSGPATPEPVECQQQLEDAAAADDNNRYNGYSVTTGGRHLQRRRRRRRRQQQQRLRRQRRRGYDGNQQRLRRQRRRWDMGDACSYDGDIDDNDGHNAAPSKRKRREWLRRLPDHDSSVGDGYAPPPVFLDNDCEVCCCSICLAFLWNQLLVSLRQLYSSLSSLCQS